MARPRKPDGRRVTLRTKVSEDTAARLDRACAEDGLTPSAALDAAARFWLDARDGTAPLAARVTPDPDPLLVPFSSAERQ